MSTIGHSSTMLNIRVGTLAHGEVLTCPADFPLGKAIAMMHAQRRSSIVITRDNRPVGMWTEHDCLTVDSEDKTALAQPISDWMSSPVQTMSAHASAEAATFRMRKNHLRHLVIVDDEDRLVGIVSQSDLIRVPGSVHQLHERDIASIIRRQIVQTGADTPIADLQTQMRNSGGDSAIIHACSNGDFAISQVSGTTGEIGIVTERDIVAHLANSRPGATAWDIASHPVRLTTAQTSLQEAREEMIEHGIRHLVVVEEDSGTVLGILSFNDLLAAIEHDYLQHMHHAMEDRDTALARAQKSLHLTRKIIESSPDGIVIVSAEGKIEDINPAFTRVTGYSRHEAIGQSPSILQSGRHDETFYRAMWRSLSRGGRWQGEIWNRRKSGEIYPEWLSIIAIRDEDGRIIQYAGIFTDITDRKQTGDDIRRLSHYDDLTGFPNRRRFVEVLGRALGEHRNNHQKIGVLVLDIDNFQRINNSLGHATGDGVLVDFAGRLYRKLGAEAVLARMGADDFAILLPHVDGVESITELAQDLMSVFDAPHFSTFGAEIFITASMGIATFPRDGTDTTMLLRNAEIAMARAKTRGRNQFSLYTRAMNAPDDKRLSLESNLRHALERDEFRLAYQPQFSAHENRLTGFEALLRWQHPKLGNMPPTDFIPIAEETGLIDEIGQWVLQTACKQMVAWREQGMRNISMAVNVSLLQFDSPVDLGNLIANTLNETGLAGDRLEIEITESLFMQDIADVQAKLKQISDLGVKIALDDFGTGFSSLSYLRHLSFDTIKIDRSFVCDIGQGVGGRELVRTIINMAHNLGKKCIAEGVETERQLRFLRDNKCDLIQGYLTGKPMPPHEIDEKFLPIQF